MSRSASCCAARLALAWGRGGGPLLAVRLLRRRRHPAAAGRRRRAPERLAAVAPGAAWVALALATPAVARAAVRARLRGRRPRPAGARPGAAGAGLRRQVPGPVAGHRRAAGARRAGRRHRAGRRARAGAPDLRLRPARRAGLRLHRRPRRGAGLGEPARRPADRGDRAAAVRPAGDLRRRRHRGRGGRRRLGTGFSVSGGLCARSGRPVAHRHGRGGARGFVAVAFQVAPPAFTPRPSPSGLSRGPISPLHERSRSIAIRESARCPLGTCPKVTLTSRGRRWTNPPRAQ